MPQDIETAYMIAVVDIVVSPYNRYGDSLRELGGTMTFNIKVKAKSWAEVAAKMAELERVLKDA